MVQKHGTLRLLLLYSGRVIHAVSLEVIIYLSAVCQSDFNKFLSTYVNVHLLFKNVNLHTGCLRFKTGLYVLNLAHVNITFMNKFAYEWVSLILEINRYMFVFGFLFVS